LRKRLPEYEAKRDFGITPEPAPGTAKPSEEQPSFVVHKHDASRLHYDVVAGRFLGLPLPKALLPRSETAETVVEGVFRFDVCLSLPFFGLLAHYRGWLKPDPLVSDAASDRG